MTGFRSRTAAASVALGLAALCLAVPSAALTASEEIEAGVKTATDRFDAVLTLDLAALRDIVRQTRLLEFLDADPARWELLTGSETLTSLIRTLLNGDATMAFAAVTPSEDGLRLRFAAGADGADFRAAASVLDSSGTLHVHPGETIVTVTDFPDFAPRSFIGDGGPAYAAFLKARDRWGGGALFIWMKPALITSVAPLDLESLGLNGLESAAFGLRIGDGGRAQATAALSADLRSGPLDMLFSEPRPLSLVDRLTHEVDGLFVTTFDGRKVLAQLRETFKDDPETLDKAIAAIEGNLGVSAEAVTASILPEQALFYTNLDGFGPANMHWNSLTLFQRAGVVALKTEDDLLRKALEQLFQTLFDASVNEVRGGDMTMSVANLVEIEGVALLQSFFGRYGDWTAAGLSYGAVRNAAKALEEGGSWGNSARVREIFGGSPPASSGLAYLDLPPELGWPLMLTSWGATGREPAPPGLATNWSGVGVNVKRLPDALELEVHSPNVAGVLATWLEAGLVQPLSGNTAP